MSISVYLASPFQEQARARAIRDFLAEFGIGCTARWLEEECSLPQGPGVEPTDEQKARFARMDRYDVRRAQAVVLWNPGEFRSSGTGGRHAEAGMGFMLAEMPVFVLGVKSNIFAWLPEAVHVPVDAREAASPGALRAAVGALVSGLRHFVPDFGPTWDEPGARRGSRT